MVHFLPDIKRNVIINKSFMALYKMITQDDNVSPFAGIILNLCDEEKIPGIVQSLLNMPSANDDAIGKALHAMCDWLCHIDCSPLLNVWIKEIMIALKVVSREIFQKVLAITIYF
jgi:hypothetical protein